jgi:hypothetical protein
MRGRQDRVHTRHCCAPPLRTPCLGRPPGAAHHPCAGSRPGMTTENRTRQATTGGDGDGLSIAWIDRLSPYPRNRPAQRDSRRAHPLLLRAFMRSRLCASLRHTGSAARRRYGRCFRSIPTPSRSSPATRASQLPRAPPTQTTEIRLVSRPRWDAVLALGATEDRRKGYTRNREDHYGDHEAHELRAYPVPPLSSGIGFVK